MRERVAHARQRQARRGVIVRTRACPTRASTRSSAPPPRRASCSAARSTDSACRRARRAACCAWRARSRTSPARSARARRRSPKRSASARTRWRARADPSTRPKIDAAGPISVTAGDTRGAARARRGCYDAFKPLDSMELFRSPRKNARDSLPLARSVLLITSGRIDHARRSRLADPGASTAQHEAGSRPCSRSSARSAK